MILCRNGSSAQVKVCFTKTINVKTLIARNHSNSQSNLPVELIVMGGSSPSVATSLLKIGSALQVMNILQNKYGRI